MPASKIVFSNDYYLERATTIKNITQKFENFKDSYIPDELVLALTNDINNLKTETSNACPDNEHIRRVKMLLRLNKKLMERKNNII